MVEAAHGARLLRLAAEIRADRGSAARQAAVVAEALAQAPWPADDPRLAVVALGAHHVYCAFESAFERIAAGFEGMPDRSERWHQDLLAQMALDLQGVRGAVIGAPALLVLRRLMQFRHFVRHAYAVALDPAQLQAVAADVGQANAVAGADLERFAAALVEAAGLA